ncbi:MAG: Shikimate dehydrogenase (NADP(+)) [Rhodobiaceae bacterium UBA7378]|nr:MAG: Shikimate dehydrogenase (NADP(+)) [Rhodobiaceae bacterium UBA7378]
MTARFGVIGWPVAHSRSPLIHNYWLQQAGIDALYEHVPVPPEADFRATLETLRAAGFSGVNVTIPHKEAAFTAVDTRDAAAEYLGAVNTICLTPEKITGHNTDGLGFIDSLQDAPERLTGPALVLGAGGAARAILGALIDAGIGDIRVANRTRARAQSLLDLAPASDGVRVFDWDDRAVAAQDARLLVNTTSLGMQGAPALDMPLDMLAPDALVADIVYTPLTTDLLARAQARGLTPINGLGMLVHQAAHAFALWLGHKPQFDTNLRDQLHKDLGEA